MVVGQATGALIFGLFTLMGKRAGVSAIRAEPHGVRPQGQGNHATEYSVAAVIMAIQLVIGTLGFYAIRTFEKWTVPVLGGGDGGDDGRSAPQPVIAA